MIIVEGNVDLAGIESMPKLAQLLIFDCQQILPYTSTSSEPLNLTRVEMPYAPGVTEQLMGSPVLRNLEVEGGNFGHAQGLVRIGTQS